MNPYDIKDIKTSYQWLGHKPQFTELNAFHKDFRQGSEHYEWNFKNRTFPKIAYATKEADIINFVQKYPEEYQLVMSLNPRPKIFTNKRNFPRSAKESEIQVSTNMLFDFDCIDTKYLSEKLASLEINFQMFDQYFLDLGLQNIPVRACTGRGYHLLFAFPKISTKEHPDIASRIKAFQGEFRNEFSKVLDEIGVRLDNTYDLRRMTRIYGTAKPTVGYIADFFGKKRQEDEGIKNYLLNIKVPERKSYSIDDRLNGDLPKLFQYLLQIDPKLQELWQGTGKSSSQDTSRSGYDFSIVKHLLDLGYSNVDDLKQVLKKRPKGAVKESGKGESYVKHTLANAIKS